ncbi:fungal hydrophobin-domain-containing protein [Trametes meyenii]|nr:fungal hydrophobin-domain-containing protein [Trametes meyenii]
MVARITAAFVALVAAAATVGASAIPRGYGDASCNTGVLQCCNQITDSHDKQFAPQFSLLGLDLNSVTAPIGVTCSPINVIGAAGGAKCEQNPVCCEDNSYGGVFSLGCVPASLPL